MSDPADMECTWEREPGSSREWHHPVEHPEEDSEPLRTLQMIWNYCPYCGRPIKVTARAKGVAKDG